MKRIIFLFVIIISIVNMIFKYHSRWDRHANSQIKKTYTVIAQPLVAPLYFTGIIMPYQVENISSPIDGAVKAIYFNYGQNVEKGQILFEVSSSKLQQIFQEALSSYLKNLDDYNDKNRQYKASINLRKLQFISDDDFYSKKNARDESYLLLIESQTKLKETLVKLGLNTDVNKYKKMGRSEITDLLTNKPDEIKIKAPISGIALSPIDNSDQAIVQGSAVKQDQVLTTIGALNSLSIIVKVSEVDIEKIHSGLNVKITGPAFPGVILNGFVDSVDNQATSDGTSLPTFPVRIKVNQLSKSQQKKIHIGMSAKVEIDIESKHVIKVPIKAIYQKNNQTFVNVRDHNKINSVAVVTGDTTLDSVIIKSGLKSGDNIVYDG